MHNKSEILNVFVIQFFQSVILGLCKLMYIFTEDTVNYREVLAAPTKTK